MRNRKELRIHIFEFIKFCNRTTSINVEEVAKYFQLCVSKVRELKSRTLAHDARALTFQPSRRLTALHINSLNNLCDMIEN